MELTRLIVKGGVLSPGELREIVNMGLEQGLDAISFGSRQDIIFPKGFKNNTSEKIGKHHFVLPNEKSGNNIVSSYVSTDIFRNTPWLTGNKFLYILEQFKEQPQLKVNITDPKQQLVPLFTGHINFIASRRLLVPVCALAKMGQNGTFPCVNLQLGHWQSVLRNRKNPSRRARFYRNDFPTSQRFGHQQ